MNSKQFFQKKEDNNNTASSVQNTDKFKFELVQHMQTIKNDGVNCNNKHERMLGYDFGYIRWFFVLLVGLGKFWKWF